MFVPAVRPCRDHPARWPRSCHAPVIDQGPGQFLAENRPGSRGAPRWLTAIAEGDRSETLLLLGCQDDVRCYWIPRSGLLRALAWSRKPDLGERIMRAP